MELSDKVKNWIDISEYDLETAEAMLQTRRLLYVGFMCHQAVEKLLKAYYEHKLNTTPPYTHDLERLAVATDLWKGFSDDQKELINYLQPLNVQARYTIYKDKIFASLSYEKCEKLILQTKELIAWIKKLL